MGFSGQPRTARLSGTQQVKPQSIMNAHLRKTGWIELFLLGVRRRRRYRVEGISMMPLLKPEDEVLIASSASIPLNAGDIVVARHPHRTDLVIVKKIEAITSGGQFVLAGLNSEESTDSRDFGAIDRADVIGKVTSVFSEGIIQTQR
jgi:nickel-type superoxide dismutase maturation protease